MRKQNSLYNFKHLVGSSQSFICNGCVRFVYGFSNDEYLYLMVNKKYGSAPARNVFKRRVRALFNALKKKHSDLAIGLMIKPLKQNISYQDLRNCFGSLDKKMKLENK